MLKILLINPYDPLDKEYGPPRMGLGLAYLVSVLQKERSVDVLVLDKFAEYRLNNFNVAKTERKLDEILRSYKPDVVGFTSYTETIADVIKDTRRVKKQNSDALTVIGGPHATAVPEETLKHYNFIDVAIIGEGEQSLLDVVKGVPLDDIPGIVYRRNDVVKRTKPRMPAMDIDAIPFPSRKTMHMDYYSQPSKEVHSRGSYHYATLLGSRGCIGGCSFCLQVKVHRRFSAHSPDYIIKDIEGILSSYPETNALEFLDNLFLFDYEMTEKLCAALIKSGINKRIMWKAQTRVDKVRPEILSIMKEAGCFMLGFGFESGSQRILDQMNKRVTVKECLASARAVKDAGILLEAYFIYGYPGETRQEFLQTLEIIRRLNPDFVGFGRFSPVPGSLDYDRLLKQNKIRYRYDDTSLDWEKINLYKENAAVNYTAMGDQELEALTEKALYEVIKPINIRRHMRNIDIKDMLTLPYMGKLLMKSSIIFSKPKYFFDRANDFLKIVLQKRK